MARFNGLIQWSESKQLDPVVHTYDNTRRSRSATTQNRTKQSRNLRIGAILSLYAPVTSVISNVIFNAMSVIVCPGMHPPQLTHAFLRALGHSCPLVFPAESAPAYSPLHLLEFIADKLNRCSQEDQALLFIAFSAGTVGAVGAARRWQRQGGQVKALIAIDGWGVPLWGDFPIHRISHDAFTHWSSIGLGNSQDSFYAEPSVAHLDLWRSPQTTQGCWMQPVGSCGESSSTAAQNRQAQGGAIALTALEFLQQLLFRYGEGSHCLL